MLTLQSLYYLASVPCDSRSRTKINVPSGGPLYKHSVGLLCFLCFVTKMHRPITRYGSQVSFFRLYINVGKDSIPSGTFLVNVPQDTANLPKQL